MGLHYFWYYIPYLLASNLSLSGVAETQSLSSHRPQCVIVINVDEVPSASLWMKIHLHWWGPRSRIIIDGEPFRWYHASKSNDKRKLVYALSLLARRDDWSTNLWNSLKGPSDSNIFKPSWFLSEGPRSSFVWIDRRSGTMPAPIGTASRESFDHPYRPSWSHWW
jgi:hypothetical protein